MNTAFETISSNQSSLQFLTSVAEAAPLAICVIEMPSQRYLWANSKYCRMLPDGIHRSEIHHYKVSEVLRSPTPDAVQALHDAHERDLPTQFGTLESKNMVGGTTYWTGATMPVWRAGDTTLVLALLVEITDKVMAERRLLEERHKKDQFITLAVHELRTPLTALKLLTQLLIRHGDKEVDCLTERLQSIDAMSTRLSGLINDLLDAVKVGSDKLVMRLSPVQLNTLVAEVAGQFQSLHSSHSVRLDVPLGNDCYTNIDAGRFTQVLLNLLGNATRYSKSGSSVHVRLSSFPDKLLLEVKDQGIGIAHENLERVFERYFQASQTFYSGGLGVGLFLVREMVTRMNGKVWAESAGQDHGASFFVELPKLTVN